MNAKKICITLFFFYICPLYTKNSIIRHAPTNENNIINASLTSDTFLNCGSNVALLNTANSFDTAFFVQSLLDLNVIINTPPKTVRRKIEFAFGGRVNTILGSENTTQLVTPDKIKIGHSITENEHTHAFNKPMIWLKEGWTKIHSESGKSFVQCGFFPKQIGLGLVLGNGYRLGTPLLINNTTKFIDQYRPGIQFHTTVNNDTYEINGYCGFEEMNSVSIDQQIGMTRSQELQESNNLRFTRKEKNSFQNTYILLLEGKTNILKQTPLQERSLTIAPFLMYRSDANETVEFYADAKSKLWTLGASCNFTYKKFFGTFDFAAQIGRQKVKAWDRNIAMYEGTKVLTHLFYRATNSATAWDLSTAFPSNHDIGLHYASGEEFIATEADGTIPAFTNFQNSYSRFRKGYTNTLSGILFAADCGYTYNDSITFGGIFGLISGDSSPNDTEEKVLLHRYSNNWDKVRKDKNSMYFGFQGVNSLYSGRSVQSHYLLRSNRIPDSISASSELTPNSCSDLGYLGFGIKFNHTTYNNKQWNIQPNCIFMFNTHRSQFGYDPTIFDTYSPTTILPTNDKYASALKKLPLFLGTEINATMHFYDSENITFYGALSLFMPGDHYNEIKNKSYKKLGKVIPIKNQLRAEKANISGIETSEQDRITLLNNCSLYGHLGISLNFDSMMQFFTKQKRTKKRSKNGRNRFIKK